MVGEISRFHRIALFIRRIAKIWSILSLILITAIIVGEIVSPHSLPPSSFRDIIGLVLFPFGVCLGMLLAWRWEGLGGIISVACFFGFYSALWLFDRRLPRGPYFALVAAPGLLFLVSYLLDRAIEPSKSI